MSEHVDLVLALDRQQGRDSDTAKRCPTHGDILGVHKSGAALLCTHWFSAGRMCDYGEPATLPDR